MLSAKIYKKRRQRLLRKMAKGPGNKIAIIANSGMARRNGGDLDFPFRDDSNFWYLTGFSEPDAVLVLVADENPRSILFCKELESESFIQQAFYGYSTGTKEAVEKYGFDEAYPITETDWRIPITLGTSDTLYYLLGKKPEHDARVLGWVSQAKGSSRHMPITTIRDLYVLLSEMRLIKSPQEIELLRKACCITGGGAIKAMQACRPGLMEYRLDAKIQEWFRSHGCNSLPAFGSVIAGGGNATTLHYGKNDCALRDGDLVQIDIGAEYKNYSGDVSRVFPVNGKFTDAQRAVYQIVLDAQKSAIEQVVEGNAFGVPHKTAVRIITEGLVKLGILKGDVDELIALGNDAKNPPEMSYRRFFMHGTSHWLGLDTHDVGNYYESDGTQRILKAGMVLTVEPGIYIKPADDIPKEYWNIGIRIEDDVLIEKTGRPFVLSLEAPKEIADIEELMSFSKK